MTRGLYSPPLRVGMATENSILIEHPREIVKKAYAKVQIPIVSVQRKFIRGECQPVCIEGNVNPLRSYLSGYVDKCTVFRT